MGGSNGTKNGQRFAEPAPRNTAYKTKCGKRRASKEKRKGTTGKSCPKGKNKEGGKTPAGPQRAGRQGERGPTQGQTEGARTYAHATTLVNQRGEEKLGPERTPYRLFGKKGRRHHLVRGGTPPEIGWGGTVLCDTGQFQSPQGSLEKRKKRKNSAVEIHSFMP